VITDKLIRRGVHTSVAAVEADIRAWNQNPKLETREVSLAVVADYKFPSDASWRLFEAVAPVEARWTKQDPSNWYIHLGTDPSRPPGPIAARVLPELMPDLLRAEAFLMIHGNRLSGLPVQTSSRGLVVAAGVDVSAHMVSFPAVA
jgi:hypothetical protein